MFLCERISKSFDGTQALVNVNLRFPSTGITAIIGPNGAGKTTLLNILSGFQRPTVGRCFFNNHNITNMLPHRIARLGIARTFQTLRLIQKLTVLDHLLLAQPRQKGEKLHVSLFGRNVQEDKHNREIAHNVLSLIGGQEYSSASISTLSYGQQKMLTLGCCLATGASMLLLDEPLAGLSPFMVERTLGLLSKLRAERKTIILIEHDLESVRQLCDSVVVVSAGRLIAVGPPATILDRPNVQDAYLE